MGNDWNDTKINLGGIAFTALTTTHRIEKKIENDLSDGVREKKSNEIEARFLQFDHRYEWSKNKFEIKNVAKAVNISCASESSNDTYQTRNSLEGWYGFDYSDPLVFSQEEDEEKACINLSKNLQYERFGGRFSYEWCIKKEFN